jgi:hypothetical protein
MSSRHRCGCGFLNNDNSARRVGKPAICARSSRIDGQRQLSVFFPPWTARMYAQLSWFVFGCLLETIAQVNPKEKKGTLHARCASRCCPGSSLVTKCCYEGHQIYHLSFDFGLDKRLDCLKCSKQKAPYWVWWFFDAETVEAREMMRVITVASRVTSEAEGQTNALPHQNPFITARS